MSNTKHIVRGKEYPAKTRKKGKDRKFFGFTSGTHSQFEAAKKAIRLAFEETPVDSRWYALRKKRWEEIKDQSYPVKNVDFVKHGYGTGVNKKNKTKNYKREIN